MWSDIHEKALMMYHHIIIFIIQWTNMLCEIPFSAVMISNTFAHDYEN